MKAVRILRLVAEQPNGVAPKEVAVKLGLAPATAFHLLATLADEGLLVKQDRRYHLGPTVGLLADAFLREHSSPPELISPLRRLADDVLETAYLSCWRQGEITVTACFEGAGAVRVEGPHTGFVGHAHARASGKALLAALSAEELEAYLRIHGLQPITANTITDAAALRHELRQIAATGVAADDEEFRPGVSCLAVPVMHEAATVAAYALAAPTQRMREHRDRYIDRLRRAATDASASARTDTAERS